jgi:cytoskeleton protein RodZ
MEPGSAGATLAAARTARGLSPAQAAEQMRLTAEVVVAMEEGRYEALGPTVFARGHLRKYANLLGVPADGVLAAYDASSSRAAESTLIPPASAHTPVGSHRVPDLPWLVLLAAVVVLGAAAAGGWWLWQSRSTGGDAQAEQTAVPASTSQPASGEVPAAQDQQDDYVPPAIPAYGEPLPEEEVVPAAGPESATPVEPPAPATSGNLIIEFTGPCWLEVYDAAGERLAFELVVAGDSRTFGGPAPWRVLLGNVGAARVSIDGSVVQIPPSLRVRDAALVSVSGRGDVAPADAVRDS